MRIAIQIAGIVVGSVAFVASCHSCAKQSGDTVKRTQVNAPEEQAQNPLQLEPLPAPPAIKIAPGSFAAFPHGPVAVVVARPQGEVKVDTRPAITFNKPLVSLGDRDAMPAPPIRLSPAVKGAWHWIGSSSVEFVPDDGRLPWATHFTVDVDAGLQAVDGEVLPKPYSFSFETLHPEIARTDPEDGWRWLAPDASIDVAFNQPMASDLDKHIALAVDGKPVPFALSEVKPKKDEAWFDSTVGKRSRMRITPQSTIAFGAKVTVTIDGARAAEGSIALPTTTMHFEVAGPFRFTGVKACPWQTDRCSYGPVELDATNEPDTESLASHVHFTPDAVVDVDELSSHADTRNGASATVTAKFRPGTKYTVVVDAGVKDVFGETAPAFTGTFSLDDVEPDLRVDNNIALLEKNGDESYPVEAVNVKKVHASIQALTPAQFAIALGRNDRNAVGTPSSTIAGAAAPMEHDLDTSTQKNVAVRVPLKLGAFVAGDAPKLFRVSLSAPETGGEKDKRVVLAQVTDLAAHAKLGATSSVVWVTSLSTGKPVAGASVKLFNTDGDELTSAGTSGSPVTTDADGVAKIDGVVDLLKAYARAHPKPSGAKGTKHRRSDDDEDRWYEPQLLVSASKDGDTGVTFSAWSEELGPGANGIREDWDGDRPRALGAVVVERGIYRPGDEVFVKGVLRLRKRGEITTPTLDSTVEVNVDVEGKNVTKQRVQLTKFGTFSTKVKVPADGALGVYEVNAKSVVDDVPLYLSTSFRVEEYRAPKFKVDVHADKPQLVAGDRVIAHVDARYLFGGAMPGADVEAQLMRDTTEFHPEGFDKYQFGVNLWGFDDGEPQTTSDVAAKKTAHVADDGSLALDMGEAEPIAGRTTTLTVEADVADVSREHVANRATMVVHPAAVYAGVRVAPGTSAGGFAEVGKPVNVAIVAVDVDGKRTGGVPVAVEVRRREWKSVRKKDKDSGRFTTLSEPEETAVTSCKKTSDLANEVTCAFTPDKAGLYVVDAVATDDKGRTAKTSTSTYVIGSGWVSWQRTDGDTIEIVEDKKSYEPGETAQLLIKSPWPDAEALVTVEREGVLSTKHVKVSPGGAIPIQLDDASVPNVFVSAILVRGRVAASGGAAAAPASATASSTGVTSTSPSATASSTGVTSTSPSAAASSIGVTSTSPSAAASSTGANAAPLSSAAKEIDPGRPQVRVGYQKLVVVKKKKRLDVAVDTGAPTHRPGEKMKVRVSVTGADKKGVPAEVTLWAVDEAVLRLTEYSVPDLVEAIHPERGLSVRLGEPLLYLVKQQAYGEKGRPPGGGGGAGGGGFRSSFKTTAFFVPDVVTDDSGSAEVTVTLPDDLTTYRVMALAVTEGDRAGSGRADIVVNKPLLALPALPRLARVGDSFSAGVVVHAEKSADVVVRAHVDGLTLAGPTETTAHVEGGKAQEVRFNFKANEPGRARFRFEVTGTIDGKAERDGVEHLLPVVLPMVIEHLAASGTVDDGSANAKRTEGIVPPDQVWPGVGGLDVTLASTELAGFQEAMQQLVEYPYGCAEQLSSRLVPFLALRELEGAFGVAHPGSADPGEEKRMRSWLGLDESTASSDLTNSPIHPDDVAKKTIAALTQLQNDDGGFKYWSSSTCSDPWASSYVTLALSRAKELGYPVDPFVVAKAQKFLAERVAVDQLPACTWGKRKATPEERTFATWVLARTSVARAALVENLAPKRNEMPLFARAMLTDAAFIAKDKLAATMLQEIMNGAKETARDVHFEETGGDRWSSYWSSDTRTSAIVLMTLVDGQPDHPFVPKLAQWLLTAKKNGRYRNTQEAAFALMAMSEVVRAKERNAPDFNATVSLSDKPLVEAPFKGRSLDVVTRHLGVNELGAKGAQLTFVKSGAGILSYTAAMTYAKKEMPTTPLDAGIAVQRWFEPWSAKPGSGQAHRVRAGELVRVKVRVASAAERKFVAVDVPIPAGLEIVDESLSSSVRLSPVASEADEGGAPGSGDDEPWSPFNNVELRDDRAIFFADDLPPGVQTASFAARATTAGVFVSKPATAEEMYSPEVSGRSDGGTFEVVTP